MDTLVETLKAIALEALEKHRLWGTRCGVCGSLYEDHTYHGDMCPHQEGPCTRQRFTRWDESVRYDA